MKRAWAREAREAFFHPSIFIKAALLLFLTICVACALTFFVMFTILQGKITLLSESLLQQQADYILKLRSHSDFTLKEISELDNHYLGGLYLKNVDEAFSMSVEGASCPREMEEGKLYMGSAARKLPVGLIRFDEEYIVLVPVAYGWQASVAHSVLFRSLLLCAGVASLCGLVAMRRAVRPLKKLNEAITQVGRGNFDVRVEYKPRDELGKFVDHFNWMVQELRGIETLRKDFVSSVSHEFKTPIAAVQGSARMLSAMPPEKLTPERLRKYTTLIIEETARMSSLSSNLLRLSKLESGTTTLILKTFSLDEQLRRSILLLENQWSQKRLEMDVQLDEADCTGDEELLGQVWINLLSNAVKFTEPGGTVTVKLRRAGQGTAAVEVSDTGIGMPEKVRERMFEPFFQGDASHKSEGNGLGLSIVRRILDLHGATIDCESACGAGTTFRVTLRDK